MACGDALVAEDPADLEHALHATDDQPLEMQLECDAQVQLHVERVVVRDERAGMGAAGFEMQHRRLDFDESLVVQRSSEAGDDLVADAEGAAGLFVDDQVGVPLPEPRVDVGEAVPLVRHRPDGLRQQLDTLHLDAELTLPRRHDGALSTKPVAEVELRERGETIVADDGLRHEQLHLSFTVHQRREDQLALLAAQHHSPGNADANVGLGSGFQHRILIA